MSVSRNERKNISQKKNSEVWVGKMERIQKKNSGIITYLTNIDITICVCISVRGYEMKRNGKIVIGAQFRIWRVRCVCVCVRSINFLC